MILVAILLLDRKPSDVYQCAVIACILLLTERIILMINLISMSFTTNFAVKINH